MNTKNNNEVSIKSKFSKENIKRFWINGKWAITELIKMSPLETILNFILISLIAAYPTINSFLYAKQVDEVIRLVGTGDYNALFSIEHPLIQILGILAVLSITKQFMRILQRYLDFRFREYHFKKYEDKITYKIAKLDIPQFEDPEISNMVLRANDNLWKVRDFAYIFNNILTNIVSLVVAGLIILSKAPLVGLLLILLSVPSTIVWSKYVSNWWGWYDKSTESFKKRGWMRGYLSNERSAKENRIISSDIRLNKTLIGLTQNLFHAQNSMRINNIKEDIFTRFINIFLDFLIPLYFIKDLIYGSLSVGDFGFLVGKAYDFHNESGNVFINIVDLFDAATGVEKVRKLVQLEPLIQDGSMRISTKTPPIIEFRNVYFKYPNTEKYVLSNVNVKINPSDEIAIVGENGAGKTTFIKLLLRFYTVTKGEILIDGVNINNLDIKNYYDKIGALFQDYNMMGFMSLKENIIISKSNTVKPLNYNKSIQFADAEKFIDALPEKDKHLLDKSFEKGTNLSTGQEQKIALARMFYRNAPILILDEPTASIDAVAEYNIFKRIYKFMTDKTVIIISHRFSTVKNAQRIIVFNKGRIVEEGSHSELLKQNGRYANAYKLQAEGYENK